MTINKNFILYSSLLMVLVLDSFSTAFSMGPDKYQADRDLEESLEVDDYVNGEILNSYDRFGRSHNVEVLRQNDYEYRTGHSYGVVEGRENDKLREMMREYEDGGESNYYRYVEKIDPITDEDSSYVRYQESDSIVGVGDDWGARLSCDGNQPVVEFHVYFYGSRLPNMFNSGVGESPREGKSPNEMADDFLSGEPFLDVIYRIDSQEPVGYTKWEASINGGTVIFQAPASDSGVLVKSIKGSDQYAVRVKTESGVEKTNVFESDGFGEVAENLLCVD